MELMTELKDFYEKVDPNLFPCFRFGLQLGVIVLSTLILFPGRRDQDASPEKRNAPSNPAARDDDDSYLDRKEGDRPTTQLQRQTKEEELQAQSDDPSDGLTPHQKLNMVVYMVLIAGVFLMFEKEYGGIVSITLRYYFPREAEALGLPPLQKL